MHSKGKARLIVAIVKCTHPDDRLLPPADKIEEMRKVVVGLGYKGEPRRGLAIRITKNQKAVILSAERAKVKRKFMVYE